MIRADRMALLAAVLLVAVAAAAWEVDEGASPSGPVVLLAPNGEPSRVDPLRTALEAHLSGYGGGVETHPLPALPEAFTDQAELARATAEERAAAAVVWIDEPHGMVFVLVVGSRAPGWIMQRPLPGGGDGWPAHADGIASMVYSALTPLVGEPGATGAAQPAARPAPTPAPAPPAQDDESPFDAAEPEPVPPPEAAVVELILRIGYGPVFVNNTEGIQHGGRIGGGVLLLEHLEIEAVLDLLVPLPADAPNLDRNIELVRWPLRFAVGGYVTYKRLDAGLKLGLVIDFTSVKGVNPDETRDDPEQVNPGFSSALNLRMRVLGWLALWVEGGFDLFGATYDYTLEQHGTILRYGGVQGRLSGGLAALFGVR